jgi:tetratricopeptide (TPR) repeat protein
MEPEEIRSELCERCREKPATETYSHRGFAARACATCHNRWFLQDVQEDRLVEMSKLNLAGKFDESLACFNGILEANRHRDHDGYLARSIASHRVLVFLHAERYAEALEESKAWAALGFENGWERWMHALGTAHALEGLGRAEEAIPVLEQALAYEDEKHLPSATGVLQELARLSQSASRPVDAKWLRLAAAIAEEYGVALPQGESVAQILVMLGNVVRDMLPKRAREDEEDSEDDPDEPSPPGTAAT